MTTLDWIRGIYAWLGAILSRVDNMAADINRIWDWCQSSGQFQGGSDKLDTIIAKLDAMETKMAALDDAIVALQGDVATLTTVDASAVALIQGFAAQLAAAIAAAQAAGATPAQLQSLTDLHTGIVANDQALAAAVAAGLVAPSAHRRRDSRHDHRLPLVHRGLDALLHAGGQRVGDRWHRDHRILSARLAWPLYPSATANKAWCNCGGSPFPRFSARRSIPEHALWLRKYRCGTSPVSEISDNDDTPSSLGYGATKPVHSDILRVQDPVGPPVPQLPQAPDDGSERPSSVI